MCQKEQETLKSALAHSIAALRPCTTRRALSAVSNEESNSFFKIGDLCASVCPGDPHMLIEG